MPSLLMQQDIIKCYYIKASQKQGRIIASDIKVAAWKTTHINSLLIGLIKANDAIK